MQLMLDNIWEYNKTLKCKVLNMYIKIQTAEAVDKH